MLNFKIGTLVKFVLQSFLGLDDFELWYLLFFFPLNMVFTIYMPKTKIYDIFNFFKANLQYFTSKLLMMALNKLRLVMFVN